MTKASTNDRRPESTVLPCVLLLLVGLPEPVSAQPAAAGQGKPYGEWQLQVDPKERQTASILSLAKGREGNPTGEWIDFAGMSALEDVQVEAVDRRSSAKIASLDGRLRAAMRG